MNRISVVITTKNSAKTLRETLTSLAPYVRTGGIGEIIVVDAHSIDTTVEVAREFGSTVVLEDHLEASIRDSSLRALFSFFHALNIGWRLAKCELVMFIDSDAYVGDDFCSRVLVHFEDDSLGILGCHARAVVRDRLSLTIGQMWEYHRSATESLSHKGTELGPVSYLYYVAAWGRVQKPVLLASGPCYVARKTCLEAIGGFDTSGDLGLSQRIVNAGWQSRWWTDAPVFHHPERNLRNLTRQRLFWGKMRAIWSTNRVRDLVVVLAAAISSTLAGLILCKHSRNFYQVPIQWVLQLTTLTGFVLWGVGNSRVKSEVNRVSKMI